MNTSLLRRACAEGIGVFALVTAGCGAIIVNAATGTLTHIGVAATFGLIVMVMVTATGHISGAHLNPAVTLAFAVQGHFSWRSVPGYILAQFLGALAGAVTLHLLFGSSASAAVTLPRGDIAQAFGVEVLLTAVLMFVISAVATDSGTQGQLAAVAIGATVALDALWGGAVSGASMNPARSLAPALVAGLWDSQWVYLIAPCLGACLGAGCYQLLRNPISAIEVSKAGKQKEMK
ncbi:MAG: aquaporin [Anaerolineae bacterium]|nr:aquaporin [Anaerolineae bacterium]